MNRPVLSVVVPFHNVAEFLPRCLNSLAKQRFKSIEYVLVDDGSTDGSAVVAKEKAAADPRFTLIEQENRGLGPARNAGARAARGTYLAFADGDDTLPRTAYASLVASLEATGSDLACGNVRRIVGGKLRPSAGHAEAFAEPAAGTHIRRRHALLADRTIWNKVFRREFWDRHGFEFPARAYEDSPVTIRAHVLSRSTDVLDEVVYHWRVRSGSISQRRTEPANVLDRLASMREVSEFLNEHAPRLWAKHDLLVTEFDLAFLLESLETAEGAEQEALLDSLAETLGVLHPKAIARQPSIRRLELHLAANRMVPELREVRMFRRASLSDAGAVRHGWFKRRRWFMDYPYLRDPAKGIPDSVYDPSVDFQLKAVVDGVEMDGTRMTARGYAYITHLDSSRTTIDVWFLREGVRLPLEVKRVARMDATADSGQSATCHDDAGFEASIDLADVPPGRWNLHCSVRDGEVVRKGVPQAHPDTGHRRYPPGGVHQPSLTEEGLVLRRPVKDRGHAWIEWSGDRIAVTTRKRQRLVFQKAIHRPGDDGRVLITPPARVGVWRIRKTDGTPLRLRVGVSPSPRRIGVHLVSFRTELEGEVLVVVQPALEDDERGRFAERRLRGTVRHFKRSPIRETVVFDAYGGRLASCNPRAIFEEMRSRDLPLEYVWVTRDGSFETPEDSRVVLHGSKEHEHALATARYLVGNRTQPNWYTKPPGQTYLQTWHGTPLKKLGHDLRDLPFRRTELLDWMARDVPQWDLLISPNPFSTPIMRRAFGYRGVVLSTGYPRNDLLFADRSEAIKRRLGVPAGKKVVLYAPTWRDDLHRGKKRRLSMELDLARMRFALKDHVVLVRAHHLITDRPKIKAPAIDVTGYPEIADLYLAADVLVTDYSSAMFDFACTGKPMVFFTYDLERYRDTLRGFYFDFTAEAPGPLTMTTDETIDAIREAAVPAAYGTFRQKFCPWDDGRASSRVVDLLLSGSRMA
ncbi:bifunctional glycosyltransferase/CDP-glycerol:glycerophosphate glycerophosphotransferase [Herbidospora daliensis]|uniref:bifunctional glycosyltransferase/CDP-glycerol:glycerophosphate glycerophosphotransferase n=1 Tax=Herbidospora daliensis TaxID=295585 RepID=UPI000780FF20|nr:bifunctional glycosyltransferase/CDP-glycerol:glycerophosphate glycerophosphotransferase [Herbidospora daliensis]